MYFIKNYCKKTYLKVFMSIKALQNMHEKMFSVLTFKAPKGHDYSTTSGILARESEPCTLPNPKPGQNKRLS